MAFEFFLRCATDCPFAGRRFWQAPRPTRFFFIDQFEQIQVMRAQHLHTGLDGIKPDLGIRLLGLDLAAGDPDGVSLVLLKGHNAHFDWFHGTLLWSDQPTIFSTASQKSSISWEADEKAYV
jgi:hypothetical protein